EENKRQLAQAPPGRRHHLSHVLGAQLRRFLVPVTDRSPWPLRAPLPPAPSRGAASYTPRTATAAPRAALSIPLPRGLLCQDVNNRSAAPPRFCPAAREKLRSLRTRIIYDRKFLLECKNSPIARTPPCYLPQIPGVTSPLHTALSKLEDLKEQNETEEIPDEDQFAMDI
uniref:Eukaryotic translation initiation factor 4E binding protein 3 n=1 Tax=Sphenodon punctatus TaxID=8508 RepID=A0A8D0HG32_SPHPU